MKERRRLSGLFQNIILLSVTAVMLIPILIVINVSMKTNEEFLKFPTLIAKTINFQNYIEAWISGNMSRYFLNSIIYTFCVVVGVVIVTAMAAFPISRGHLKRSKALYILFLMGLFLPTSLVPIVLIMKYLNFTNTIHGYVLFIMASNVPVSIFIFTGFIKGINRELDEAAIIDGCKYLRLVFSIIIPLLKPAIATVGMFTAIACWNDIINPYLFLTDDKLRPLTSGLYNFYGTYSMNWPVLSAGIILVALPLITVYLFIQKFIISGIMSGAIKG